MTQNIVKYDVLNKEVMENGSKIFFYAPDEVVDYVKENIQKVLKEISEIKKEKENAITEKAKQKTAQELRAAPQPNQTVIEVEEYEIDEAVNMVRAEKASDLLEQLRSIHGNDAKGRQNRSCLVQGKGSTNEANIHNTAIGDNEKEKNTFMSKYEIKNIQRQNLSMIFDNEHDTQSKEDKNLHADSLVGLNAAFRGISAAGLLSCGEQKDYNALYAGFICTLSLMNEGLSFRRRTLTQLHQISALLNATYDSLMLYDMRYLNGHQIQKRKNLPYFFQIFLVSYAYVSITNSILPAYLSYHSAIAALCFGAGLFMAARSDNFSHYIKNAGIFCAANLCLACFPLFVLVSTQQALGIAALYAACMSLIINKESMNYGDYSEKNIIVQIIDADVEGIKDNVNRLNKDARNFDELRNLMPSLPHLADKKHTQDAGLVSIDRDLNNNNFLEKVEIYKDHFSCNRLTELRSVAHKVQNSVNVENSNLDIVHEYGSGVAGGLNV